MIIEKAIDKLSRCRVNKAKSEAGIERWGNATVEAGESNRLDVMLFLERFQVFEVVGQVLVEVGNLRGFLILVQFYNS